MEPIFFGTSGRQLYGVHHAPRSQSTRRQAVLLCYPAMQEYMGSHWAFRKLAASLGREGFHVLRFDYFGTGNSAGEPEEARVEDWLSDIATAAAELADLADVRRISLVGLRLGAALAAIAAKRGCEVADLVLWEPVTDGAGHVRELRQGQREKWALTNNAPPIGADELLGYHFPPAVEQSIESIDITDSAMLRADRVHIVTARRRPEYSRLEGQLRDRSGGSARLHIVPADPVGTDAAFMLSSGAQREITATLAAAS
jgi:pimeloyl-ACP methyl ester carboxylesterase